MEDIKIGDILYILEDIPYVKLIKAHVNSISGNGFSLDTHDGKYTNSNNYTFGYDIFKTEIEALLFLRSIFSNTLQVINNDIARIINKRGANSVSVERIKMDDSADRVIENFTILTKGLKNIHEYTNKLKVTIEEMRSTLSDTLRILIEESEHDR